MSRLCLSRADRVCGSEFHQSINQLILTAFLTFILHSGKVYGAKSAHLSNALIHSDTLSVHLFRKLYTKNMTDSTGQLLLREGLTNGQLTNFLLRHILIVKDKVGRLSVT